ALVAALRPAILDRDGATLDPAEFAQSLHESGDPLAHDRRRGGAQQPDGGQLRRLLRARRKRPRSRSAAEKRDELTPLHRCNHSTTWSGSERKLSEIVTPSAFAVFKLITNWNLTVSITGRSAGLTPLSTRPVYTPTRRYASEASTP